MSMDRHDWHSSEYVSEWVSRAQADDSRRLTRFRLMADLIPHPKEAAIAILDVGTGYGPAAGVMLESFPSARVVAQDYSEEMLGHAKKGLASYGDRVRYHRADLFDDGWHTEAGGPFDAVVSSIAIHNLQSAPRIRQLYKEIFGVLNERGCFLNVDLVSAPTETLQQTYWELMGRRRTRETGNTAASASNAAERARTAVRSESSWPPFPGTMEEQLAWLRDAGFTKVDCFWKEMGTVLLGGFK